METVYILLGIFILLSYTTEAMSGFGSIVIALALGANFLPINVLLPILVPLSLFLSGYLFIKNRAQIDLDLLLKKILPMMVAGMIGGYLISMKLQGNLIKQLFGVMIVVFSLRELYFLILKRDRNGRGMSKLENLFWMFSGGVTHGLYASGGPLLVYSVSGLRIDKGTFRATLSTVWFSLNFMLTIIFVYSGSVNPATIKHAAVYLPIIPVGIFFGDWLHQRISEEKFRISVFLILLLAGASLIK